ncbi:B3 domain-containing transcription repressor VAL2 [Apium graveolens]|uniref:B3 domain-containing transcription repressor VAL2 n=1 Tax=Apium graveolens TaxID=4045 RepID=UPI003D7A9C45
MASKICMNALCGAVVPSADFKQGWPLRSGAAFSSLCNTCGTLYEQLSFCDVFHSDDTGWRECISCGKRLHCGCIASSSLLEILDSSGVICIRCAKSSGVQPTGAESPTRFGTSLEKYAGETHSSSLDNQISVGSIHNSKFKQCANFSNNNGPKQFLPPQNDSTARSWYQMKLEGSIPPSADARNTCLSNYSQLTAGSGSSLDIKTKADKNTPDVKDVCGSPVHTNLTISLVAQSLIPHSLPNATHSLPNVVCEMMESDRPVSSYQHGSRSHCLLPKASKPVLTAGLDPNASTMSQMRVARPPVEGRIKSQLLPRYWPRITEQELQQISGDSNSTIVPLFEKILSASDAGRIGRLVLPKACAEAYFPPISQPEGIPVRIQDVKGKEWVFQFRFWPNNNSRMYVLEGVTPCIQSMQLQAGDTVTFSRMDPEGKLLMGFRKASNNIVMQDSHFTGKHNEFFASEPFLSGVADNLPIMNGYSGLLQSMNRSTDPHTKVFSKQLSSSSGDAWHVTDKHGSQGIIGSLPPTLLAPERKRSRNIGSKSKRLLIDNQEALELKLTWEEVQEMLHPPASIQPTTVTIEDHEFEEYEAPPVLGKRSIFIARSSGEQEQWTTCDCCFKWRRLPSDFLLPPTWRCQENVWDRSRCSCSAPDELSPSELEQLLKMNNDFKRRRIAVFNQMPTLEHDSSTPGILSGSPGQGDVSSPVATTTRHPRHRPGCSCIVCIQPPSGKGKHKPTCTCNVCMTVKRRFKTLMLRKKKRQSDLEAEIAQRNQFIWGPKEELEVESSSRQGGRSLINLLDDKSRSGSKPQAMDMDQRNDQPGKDIDTYADELDLNCQPGEDFPVKSTRVSMVSLLQVASRPLETYLKQTGLTSLLSEHQTSSGSHALPQAATESEGQPHQNQSIMLEDQGKEPGSDDKVSELFQNGTEPL